MTLTSVTGFDEIVGILINGGPIKAGIKHLFGGVVWIVVAPRGTSMASLENVNGFLTVHTPPDDLIRTDLEQERVVPEIVFHIFEEFIFLLGRHPFPYEVTRMVICKVGKPWG